MTFEEAKEEFHKYGFELLDKEYNGANYKHLVRCNICEYEYRKTMGHTTSKEGCISCGWKKTKDKQKIPIENVKSLLKEGGLILISDNYENTNTLLKVQCELNHVFERSFTHFKKSLQCPQCKLGLGIGEEICRFFIEYLFDKLFIKAHPKWLNGLELDGYNEELSIAFERQGQQHYEYHSFFFKTKDDFIKRLEADKLKLILCIENNVKLIIIPYWIKTTEILQFIKDECVKLKINYPNKPNIELDKISVFNKEIEKKNLSIDSLTEKTDWIRFSNYNGVDNELMLKCKKCDVKTTFICYNLIKNLKNNKEIKCKNCFDIKTQIKINSILNKQGLICCDKFQGHRLQLEIMCIYCNFIQKIKAGYIITRRTNIKCPNCKK